MRKLACTTPVSRFLLLALAALVIVGWSGDDYQQGLSAYERKDYNQAFAVWLPLAEQGHVEAQFNVGYMYVTGQGVGQDREIGVNWYRKAAALGHAKAQFNLGLALLKGEGVSVDLGGAVKWLQKAVDQGYAPAQHALGSLSGVKMLGL